jgi:hypothetical protein
MDAEDLSFPVVGDGGSDSNQPLDVVRRSPREGGCPTVLNASVWSDSFRSMACLITTSRAATTQPERDRVAGAVLQEALGTYRVGPAETFLCESPVSTGAAQSDGLVTSTKYS